MRTFFKLILILGVLGYLVFASVKFLNKEGHKTCKGMLVRVESPDVDGAPDTGGDMPPLVDSSYVARVLGSHGVRTERVPMDSIDLLLIDSLLESDPYIDEVNCYLSAMANLCVDVTVVRPVVRVFDESGSEYLVDSRGRVIPSAPYFLDLPVATGSMSRRWAGAHLPAIGRAIGEDSMWREEVEQIHVVRDSMVTLIPRTGNLRIHLGTSGDLRGKLERLTQFYREALPAVGWNRYTDINLEYDNQIICTNNQK